MNDKKDKKFDFWNDHSLEFLEMAMKRDYQETLEQCDGYGKRQRECGDTIEIFLSVEEGMIESISYDLKGCLFSHACANTLIKLARGMNLDQAKQIEPGQIVLYLKTLPEKEEHCAVHALAAFHLAIEDYANKKV